MPTPAFRLRSKSTKVSEGQRRSFNRSRVAANSEYKRPLKFEDNVEVHLKVATKTEKAITYSFTFRKNGEPEICAVGGYTVVCVPIREGRMRAEESAAFAPFLTVVQDRTAFETLARESGDSALALLGGLSGLSGEMRLTRKRVESLGQLRGSVHFSVTGDAGFALITHFGAGPVPDEPNASIAVDDDAYRELRSG